MKNNPVGSESERVLQGRILIRSKKVRIRNIVKN